VSRDELREIVLRVIKRVFEEPEAPGLACIFGDAPDPCDITSYYGMGEEG
jgi:hypothetical protein